MSEEEVIRLFEANRNNIKLDKQLIGKDVQFMAVQLIRKRIPLDKNSSVITGASSDTVYLPSIKETIDYLTLKDYTLLIKYGVFIDQDTMAIYV